MTNKYQNHVTGREALETMKAVQSHVKRMMIKKDDGPIDAAAAFCTVSTHIVSTGTIYTAYVYLYENGRHNTFIFTNIADAANMFIGIVDRLKLRLPINAWIQPGPLVDDTGCINLTLGSNVITSDTLGKG